MIGLFKNFNPAVFLNIIKVTFPLFLVFAGATANTANLLEVNLSGESSERSKTKARQDIAEKAVEEISYQYINELIGKEKTQKNKILIDAKIVKNYLKYIPVMKVTNFKASKAGTKADVNLKVSVDNLKKMLLQEGLLYEMGGRPRVLPMVRISDYVNAKSYTWWVKDSGTERLFLQELLTHFHEKLKDEFWERGFWSLRPIKWTLNNSIPNVFRQEKPRKSDVLFVSEYFESSIVLRGQFKITSKSSISEQYRIEARIEALQASNGRVIGEVIRSYDTEMGPFQQVVNKKMLEVNDKISKDIVVQVMDSWQKGTFGSSLVRLTLKGQLDYQQLDEFKEQVLTKVRAIRALRARLFAPQSVTFEVDSSITATQLADAIKGKNFPRFKVEVGDVEANELALEVKTR